MNFKDKVVLVTGASSGLGRQIAIDLAYSGAKLALVARNYKALKSTKKLLGKTGSMISVCDVANPYDVKKTVENVLSHFGHVDILINNAGFNILSNFDKLSLNELNQIMNVNYNGSVYFIKELLPSMERNKQGYIANIASVAGLHGMPKSAAYCASKFAMVGLTESLYFELKNKGIRVSLICPGAINTNFFSHKSYKGTGHRAGKIRMMRVEYVSKVVLDTIAKNKFMAIIPLDAKLRIQFKSLFPRTFLWIVSKVFDRRFKN